ncbi:SGNH/GDSL hydrolase family protein [Aquibacillus salsiterrae]|uniref:SGNH/GDSL hydrolase family protein n=1 Tax=Aquibacillus salsiterrae TaxID=2950439 RepID=A0A9X4AGG0_9BACI|nr:SGNH/GDSL hydrolase family protein [Aquibacillus salsiterrae]MDC3418644.1 SGNH/GDSL hydrolase family protein [Aquibacillus salsiterrae]
MRKRAILVSGSILLLGVLSVTSYFLFSTNSSSVPKVMNIQMEKQQEEALQKTDRDKDSTTTTDKDDDTTLTDEIKEKVRYVIDGALGLFYKENLLIVAIGDSLTQGVGDTTKNGGYVGILQNSFQDSNQNITIQNYGKRGNRSDQLLKRLDEPEIMESMKETDLVLITIGANDIMKVVKSTFMDLRYEPFEEEMVLYEVRLRKIVNNIRSINPDADVFLIGLYNPFEKYFGDIVQLNMITENWNNAILTVASEYDRVTYVPVVDLFKNSDKNLFWEDNFHPNVDGYQLIAERVFHYIKPSIEKKEEAQLQEKVNAQ